MVAIAATVVEAAAPLYCMLVSNAVVVGAAVVVVAAVVVGATMVEVASIVAAALIVQCHGYIFGGPQNNNLKTQASRSHCRPSLDDSAFHL